MTAWHFLLHITGSDNMSSYWYGFWSGFGSDLGMLAGVIVFLRHHNCHVNGCWRLGRHAVDGTSMITCRHHHPEL